MNEMCEWGAKSSCPVDSLSLVDIGSGSVADRKSWSGSTVGLRAFELFQLLAVNKEVSPW